MEHFKRIMYDKHLIVRSMDHAVLTAENSSAVHSREGERIQVLRIPYSLNADTRNSVPDDDLRQGYLADEPMVTDTWETIEETSVEVLSDSDDCSEFVSLFTFYPPQETPPAASRVGGEHAAKMPWERFTRAKAAVPRPCSAPARPLTELEQFKESLEYSHLEIIATSLSSLTHNGTTKLNIDSFNGHNLCNQLLTSMEELARLLNIKPASRKYRRQFSSTYSSLYTRIDDYSYLVEVLDAAQGHFSHIIVNGEKYVFSSNLLKYAEELCSCFARFGSWADTSFEAVCGHNVGRVAERLEEAQTLLGELDEKWTRFERLYIFELMIIENDAKRLVVKAIKIEKEMGALELSEKFKGNLIIRSDRYLLLRKKFVETCGRINSVANYIGTGRDDLDSEVILSAEETLRQISDKESSAVRRLAQKVKTAFDSLRTVFRQCSLNLEAVDPELANNQELVAALAAFEVAWQRGRHYLLNPAVRQMLISLAQLIEGLGEKYEKARDMLETMEADVFLVVPCLAILRSLESSSRTMYSLYCPDMQSREAEEFAQLRSMYGEMKRRMGAHASYNVLEQALLEINCGGKDVERMVNKIKRLAMILQRSKPSDWNLLMETAMGIP